MAYFMVRKDRRWPYLTTDTMTQAQITALFQNALSRSGSSLSRWVGAMPRITRTGGATSAEVARVAWLLEVPDHVQGATSTAFQRARNIGRFLDGEIEPGGELPIGGSGATDRPEPIPSPWTPALVTEFSPATNGDLAWWQDGRASRTLTMDDKLSWSVERQENAIGPDSYDTRPGGTPQQNQDDQRRTTDQVVSVVKFVAIAAMVVGGAYAIGQVVPGLNLWQAQRTSRRMSDDATKQLAAAPRSNPRKGRR